MPVARLELMFATPTFAKMAVNEANKADSIAYIHHIDLEFVTIYDCRSAFAGPILSVHNKV